MLNEEQKSKAMRVFREAGRMHLCGVIGAVYAVYEAGMAEAAARGGYVKLEDVERVYRELRPVPSGSAADWLWKRIGERLSQPIAAPETPAAAPVQEQQKGE